ncbi:hypothetical protein D3C79_982470 [compost metagenome]
MALLGFDAVLGGRADQQALQADRLTTVIAPAEAFVGNTVQGHFQLWQQALVAVDGIYQPATFFFDRSHVGGV